VSQAIAPHFLLYQKRTFTSENGRRATSPDTCRITWFQTAFKTYSVGYFGILRKITGESSELGELAKTTSLPIDDPLPTISFEGMPFLFTGTCDNY